jgi:leader peptidase (prepilin peptidase)/N-methyltransferase
LITAVLFLAIFRFDGFSVALIFDLVVFSLLVVMTVYDIRHKIIPDGLVVLFVIAGLAKMFALLAYGAQFSVWNFLAGIIFYVPFYLLWKVSDGRWIGLGDGKLAIGIGTFLGFSLGLTAIVLGFWLGAIFGLIGLFFARNRLTMKSELPFAPFLILGVLIAFFSGFNWLLIGSFFIK